MNENNEANSQDLVEVTKEEKVEMNWKTAHCVLLVAFDHIKSKLERGEQPDEQDIMIPIGAAIGCLSDNYTAEELFRMTEALVAVTKIKEAIQKHSEQYQQQGDGNVH